MKNLLKRVMSIAAATALLMTSVISAEAADHSHLDGTCINSSNLTTKNDDDYTITLTYPKEGTTVYKFNKDKSHFGAYQIFAGTVKGKDTHNNPGTESESIPITDIKWGNAFGTFGSVDTKKKILEFVYALYEAPNNDTYGYAFKDFTDFHDFFDSDNHLSSEYTDSNVTVSLNDVTADSDVLNAVKFDKLAVAVADILAKPAHQKDHEWLQAFTDILGGYAQGEGGYANPGYATQYYEGFVGTGSAESEESESYTIYVPAGYYMIRDLSTIKDTDTSHAFSARMLFVADNVNQVVKVDVPRLEKEILRDATAVGGVAHETDVAGVGDNVHFQLKGTLPSNYDEYLGGYKYSFIDTLSDGLDLVQYAGTHDDYDTNANACVNVTVKGLFKWNTTESKWVWETTKILKLDDELDTSISSTGAPSPSDQHLGTGDGKSNYNYSATYAEHKLTVDFPCLKEIRIKDGTDVYCLGYNSENEYSEIYVDYYAKVNQNAVVSPAESANNRNGNYNQAQIEYSDNPQAYADTDKTTIDRATVYTFGLDIVKIDAAEFLRNNKVETKAGLKDAKFALVRPKKDAASSTTGWEIAKFIKVNGMIADDTLPLIFRTFGYYSIESWETLNTDGPSSSTPATGDTFNKDWLKGYTSDTGADGFYNITSLSDGVLNISGLDVDVTYTMVETATPNDNEYAMIDPFTITLKAVYNTVTNEYDGKLASATTEEAHTVKDGESFSIDKFVELLDPTTENPDDNGSASMLVANFKYTDLPSTGGIGVYIYYIAGGCVVALALVLFALSKKKKTTK